MDNKNITFVNKRFDPDVTPFHDLSKKLADAFGYTADLKVDKKLAQLLRLRVAQYNECTFCTILHAKTSREVGIEDAKIDSISAWYNSQLFTEKEKVALDYADVLSDGKGKEFHDYHEALTEYFDEEEIGELAAIIINMNLWTRYKLAHGQESVFEDKS